ncbi:MAG: hypothetical protein IKU29_04520, partial [Parabacteroides sp.]|nr:hypothetical protein [Parabacteroides sp.]
MPKIVTNFKFRSTAPNFDRDQLTYVRDLYDAELEDYDLGHIVFCVESNQHYSFLPIQNEDGSKSKRPTTGYFKATEFFGVQNDITIRYRLVVVYCSTTSDPNLTPQAPGNGWMWNLNTNDIIYPEPTSQLDWR